MRRSKTLQIRVTEDELKHLKKIAHHSNLTVASFVRLHCLPKMAAKDNGYAYHPKKQAV